MNFSKQREAILLYLQNTTSHPTADQIYTDLKEQYPNLSLATVYRNLNQLCGLGQICRIPVGQKTERYDANVVAHTHFVCSDCGCVFDLNRALDRKTINISVPEGFCAKDYSVNVYGICRNCNQ